MRQLPHIRQAINAAPEFTDPHTGLRVKEGDLVILSDRNGRKTQLRVGKILGKSLLVFPPNLSLPQAVMRGLMSLFGG